MSAILLAFSDVPANAEQLFYRALVGLVNGRCYPVLIPIDVALPALAYSRVSTAPIASMGCPAGMGAISLFQVDVVGQSYMSVLDMANGVRSAMIETGKATLSSMIDIQTDNPMIFRRVLTFNVMEF
ncbi:hypothetical protein VSS37_05850 [Candidatus Thiothrix sp. Deng01]|uniref:DUF3168 domain-containing protein n=1 Tax=Candidatus Thiothrix phosphatis TaxID=3112415 RepID=A0ABU6CUK4_9GAMM|nr:hypothetical protein [Candidatus Thiothrix sp. Deng01]MEB4590495.1 hypothetical protein [Candidatus Thiothrix sp. Deng01]